MKFQSLLEVIEKEKNTQPDSPLLKSGGDYYEFITAYEKVNDTLNKKNTLSEATKSKLSALKQQVPIPQTG